MSEPIQAQENHDDVIERWKNSSPYEQERLELLQQAIAEGKEKQLYDPEEQKKFGLDGDEFLVYAQCCGGPLYTFFRNITDSSIYKDGRTIFFLSLIIIIELTIFKIESQNYILCILRTISVLLFLSLIQRCYGKSRIIISITNKNIYYGYEKVDGIRSQEFFKKILLNNLDIKHTIQYAKPLTGQECYDMPLPFNLYVSKDNKRLLKVLVYRNTEEFSKRHNISNNKYCAVYILKTLSYISKIYNINICLQWSSVI